MGNFSVFQDLSVEPKRGLGTEKNSKGASGLAPGRILSAPWQLASWREIFYKHLFTLNIHFCCEEKTDKEAEKLTKKISKNLFYTGIRCISNSRTFVKNHVSTHSVSFGGFLPAHK